MFSSCHLPCSSYFRHHRTLCAVDVVKTADGTGRQGFCNIHDYFYIAPIYIGTPKQTVWVQFDTGSADTWVSSNECRSLSCRQAERFDPGASRSFQRIGRTRFKFVYGLGDTVRGYHAREKVCVGSMCINNQDIGIATLVTDDDLVIDGLMGFAYSALSVFDRPLLVTLKETLKQPVFAVWLNRDTNYGVEGGEMTLGYINNDRYEGSLDYIPVVNQSYWTVRLTNVLANDPATGVSTSVGCNGQQCRAVLDTGTSFILGAHNETAKMLDSWSRNGWIFRDSERKWTVNCQQMSKLPRLTFMLGMRSFVLTPEQYTFPEDADRACDRKLAIDGDVPDLPFWVLGDAFLGAYYTVFDFGQNRIGLAKAKKSPDQGK